MTAVFSSPNPLIERAAFRLKIRGCCPVICIAPRARAQLFPKFSPYYWLKPARTWWRLARYPSGEAVVRVRMLLLLLPLAVVSAGAAPAARDSVANPRPALRYLFDSGSAQGAAAAAGWNLLDVSSKDEADALPPGTRGLMWLGDYDNATCDWERPDAELERLLAGTARDPHIYGFLFSDEADPFACPTAPAQHRARAQLV